MTLYKDKYRIQSTRLQGYDYSSDGAYFVTICVKNGECIFGEIKNGIMGLNRLGCVVNNFWLETLNNYKNVQLDDYIIMPNHFHGIIIINNSYVEIIHELSLRGRFDIKKRRKMLIPKIIGRFKMQSAKQINITKNTKGECVWQKNYYDRIIRNESELSRICDYIRFNPGKWEYDRNNPTNLKNPK